MSRNQNPFDRPLWWLPHLALLVVIAYVGVGLFGLSIGSGAVLPSLVDHLLTGGEDPSVFHWVFVAAVAVLVGHGLWRVASKNR